MDAPLWQTVAALACVAIAAAALLRRVVRLFRSSGQSGSGCGSGCSSCPVGRGRTPDSFVPLDGLLKSDRREKRT
jgi:hypothetical protein